MAGGTVVATLNFSILFIAFASIEDTFSDTSRATLSWGLTGFSIIVATLMVPAGWLSDRIGARRLFLVGVTIMGVGTIGVALSPNAWVFLLARMVQAVGSGIELPAATVLVLAAFPDARRSTAMGAMSGVGGVAAAAGPALGGILLAMSSWRVAFLVIAPVAFVSAALGRRLPDTRTGAEGDPPDLIGAAALMTGVALMILAISKGQQWGWTSPAIAGSLAIGLASLAFMVLRSARHRSPIIDLTLYRVRNFRVAGLLSLLYLGAFAGTYLSLILFLQNVWNLSPLQAGLLAAVIPVIGGPLSYVSGRAADRVGPRPLIVAGMICSGLGALALWVLATDDRQVILLVPAMALYATGVGLSFAPIGGAAVAELATQRLGVGGAVFRIMQEIGAAVSVAVVIALLAGGDDGSAATYRPVFALTVGICALSALVAQRLTRI